MEETFERVEEHLDQRQYQASTGDWRTKYYAIFTDWKSIRRKFPVGAKLDDARDELGRLRTLNKGRYDWEAEKRKTEEQRRRAVTFLSVGEHLLRPWS